LLGNPIIDLDTYLLYKPYNNEQHCNGDPFSSLGMVTVSRDGRWPFIPFLVIRSIQIVFGIIILGLCGYIVSKESGNNDYSDEDLNLDVDWWAGMGVFIGLIVMLWGAISIVLFFLALLLPLALVIVDAFCTLFLLITMAGIGASRYMNSNCGAYGFSEFHMPLPAVVKKPCDAAKGAFAMSLLCMLIFIASTAYASVILHRTRKDLRGRKYNANLPATSTKEGATDYVQPMQTMQGTAPVQPTFDPNATGYYQQTTTSPVYTVATPPPQQPQP